MPIYGTGGRGTDDLDVRVLRALLQGTGPFPLSPRFRESLAAVARIAEADEGTVRHRVRRLHETGFVKDWRLMLNPRLWGGGQAHVLMELGPNPPDDRLAEALRLVPGAIIIYGFPRRVCVVLEYDDEPGLSNRVELCRRLAGAVNVHVAKVLLPECGITLSPRDWDLVRVLSEDLRRPYAAIAKRVRLSSRTVRRKISEMMRGAIGFAWPSLDPKALQGGVLVQLQVSCPHVRRNGVEEAVLTHLGRHIFHVLRMVSAERADTREYAFTMVVPNLAMVRDIRGWVRALPDVTAEAELEEHVLMNFEAYDEELLRRLGRMPTGRSKRGLISPSLDRTRRGPRSPRLAPVGRRTSTP